MNKGSENMGKLFKWFALFSYAFLADAQGSETLGMPQQGGPYGVVPTAINSSSVIACESFQPNPDQLPFWAVGTFNGVLFQDYQFWGLAALSISPLGNVSGKATASSPLTIATTGYPEVLRDGSGTIIAIRFSVMAKQGKTSYRVQVVVTPEGATFEIPDLICTAQLYRNSWDDLGMAGKLSQFGNYYVANVTMKALFDSSRTKEGGYIAFSFGKAGRVIAAGTLPDGTKVSGAAMLVLTSETTCEAHFVFTPSSYKKGTFYLPVEFDAGVKEVRGLSVGTVLATTFNRLSDDLNSPAFNSAIGGYQYQAELFGGEYDSNLNLQSLYPNGLFFSLDLRDFKDVAVKAKVSMMYYDEATYPRVERDSFSLYRFDYFESQSSSKHENIPLAQLAAIWMALRVDGKGFDAPKATTPMVSVSDGCVMSVVNDGPEVDLTYISGGQNDTNLKFSLNKKSGVFSGSFVFELVYLSSLDVRTWQLGEGPVKFAEGKIKKTYSYQGVLNPWLLKQASGAQLPMGMVVLPRWHGADDDPAGGYVYKSSCAVRLIRP